MSKRIKVKKTIDTKRANRPSPSESATIFKIGTVKLGGDDNYWVVVETSNGVKKWQKKQITSDAITLKKDNIIDFDFGKIYDSMKLGKLHKIGQIRLTSSRIGVGELLFVDLPTKIGIYDIYWYAGSLIAIHENEDIFDQIFSITKYVASCDVGMFSFNDFNKIKHYLWRSSRKGIHSLEHEIEEIFINEHKVPKHDAYYLYESDLHHTSDEETEPTYSEANEVVAIIASNNYGDGTFPIYQGKNAYWIMSYDVMDKLLTLIGANY